MTGRRTECQRTLGAFLLFNLFGSQVRRDTSAQRQPLNNVPSRCNAGYQTVVVFQLLPAQNVPVIFLQQSSERSRLENKRLVGSQRFFRAVHISVSEACSRHIPYQTHIFKRTEHTAEIVRDTADTVRAVLNVLTDIVRRIRQAELFADVQIAGQIEIVLREITVVLRRRIVHVGVGETGVSLFVALRNT
ncbi:hypothetical protein Barb7_02436 [Bacteroidales bacterium Barb7]|nr:hypothetical protein Barb7_02436 [Bacteroidales bacterium Barb7]